MAFIPPGGRKVISDNTEKRSGIRHIKYKKGSKDVLITIYPGGFAVEIIVSSSGNTTRTFLHTEHTNGARDERFHDPNTGELVEKFFDAIGNLSKKTRTRTAVDPADSTATTTTVTEDHYFTGKRRKNKTIVTKTTERLVTELGKRGVVREKTTTKIYGPTGRMPTKTTEEEWWFKKFDERDRGIEGKKTTTKIPGKPDVTKEWEWDPDTKKWKVVK